MTRSTTTRRDFLRLLAGMGKSERATEGFSLARFYAERAASGQANGSTIPKFEWREAEVDSTPIGSPDLVPRKR